MDFQGRIAVNFDAFHAELFTVLSIFLATVEIWATWASQKDKEEVWYLLPVMTYVLLG